jgi:hypothetical protein
MKRQWRTTDRGSNDHASSESLGERIRHGWNLNGVGPELHATVGRICQPVNPVTATGNTGTQGPEPFGPNSIDAGPLATVALQLDCRWRKLLSRPQRIPAASTSQFDPLCPPWAASSKPLQEFENTTPDTVSEAQLDRQRDTIAIHELLNCLLGDSKKLGYIRSVQQQLTAAFNDGQ